MRTAMPLDAVSGPSAYVAYPSGEAYKWDIYTPTAQNTDMQFLQAIVDSLVGKGGVDPARVFATGFSSGAFMVNQMACRQPGLFRAIASQSGGSPDEPQDPTATHWPNGYTRCVNQTLGAGPATLVVHGTSDPTVSYESGAFTADYWAYVDGCGTSQSPDRPDCQSFDGCPKGKPVVFCSIPDLGHQVWADAPTTVWSFFAAL
jgi:polyhydroxybutyrate depolymerase